MSIVSSLGDVIATLVLFVAVAVAAWWGCREGLRQGDEPADTITSVTLSAEGEPDGIVTVRGRAINPSLSPVMVSATSRLVGRFWPVVGVGRTTRRGGADVLPGCLVAIDARQQGVLSWTSDVPTGHDRLVVDIHVWQQPDRIRRHRRLITVSGLPAVPVRYDVPVG